MSPGDTDDREPLFPAMLYIFKSDGTHPGPIILKDKTSLNSATRLVARAIVSGVEVVITDPGDRAIFHAKDRKIIFPPESTKGP